MKKEDFSQDIYAKYYNSRGEPFEITLNDGATLEGIFIGFFHGEKDRGEPYIFMWRFISKEEIDDYNHSPEKYQSMGRVIYQKDIKAVRFK